MIRLLDVNNKQQGNSYGQYWFDVEGKFLANSASKPPYYHYYTKPDAKKKRWTRSYHIELEDGLKIIKYVKSGRARWWEVHLVEGGKTEKVEDHQGLPPWIQEWVDKRKEKRYDAEVEVSE